MFYLLWRITGKHLLSYGTRRDLYIHLIGPLQRVWEAWPQNMWPGYGYTRWFGSVYYMLTDQYTIINYIPQRNYFLKLDWKSGSFSQREDTIAHEKLYLSACTNLSKEASHHYSQFFLPYTSLHFATTPTPTPTLP